MDNLAAAFRLGMEPTGSADPQALRRQAIGLIRIVAARGWRLPLWEWLQIALAQLPEPPADGKTVSAEQALERMRTFFERGLVSVLEAGGVLFDVTRAALAVTWTDLLEAADRARFLEKLRREQPETWEQLVTIAERPARIRRPEGIEPGAPVNTALFEFPLEARLWNLSREVTDKVDRALAGATPDYAAAVTALLTLAPPVHDFFEQVMVMAEDPEVRRNRLALMAGLDGLFLRLGDFLKIVRPG